MSGKMCGTTRNDGGSSWAGPVLRISGSEGGGWTGRVSGWGASGWLLIGGGGGEFFTLIHLNSP